MLQYKNIHAFIMHIKKQTCISISKLYTQKKEMEIYKVEST